MSINIFNILLEPSKESENILKESNEKKIQIIVISLVLLGLVSRIYISTGIVGEILETIGQTSILSNIIGLVHSIILFVITFGIVYFIGKSLKGKATFIDTLLSYPYYICLYNTDNH